MKTFKISSAILLVVLIVSIFVLFFTASISYKNFRSVTESEKLVIHSHKVIRSLEELVSVVKDAETGQRGYLITRDSIFLEPFTSAFGKINQKLRTFKTLTENDIKNQQDLNTLYILIDQRFNILEDNIHEGKIHLEVTDTNKRLLLSGKVVMDKIRDKTAKIIRDENSKLKRRQDEYHNETQISPLTFLYTALFSLFVFVCAFIKIYRDIKLLQKANNQLLINKRIFEHSENISNTCNWCRSMEEDILTFSNNIYELLKCEEKDFDETLEGFMKFVHPEDREIIINNSDRALDELKSNTVHYRIIRKDNQVRYFQSVSKLIIDNFDKRIMIGVITDITEQYQAGKILENKLFDLERTNKELLAFNHVASHDLQEPLRKIQTFISRIDADTLPENERNYFARIKQAAGKMRKLIDDLLAFSRANKAEKSFEITDLNVLMENSIQDLAELIEEKHAIINTTTLPNLSVIPFQIQQLFLNIIGNALKYSKEDVPPIITIGYKVICGKDIINSPFTSDNKVLKISFSDNGIGFDEEYAESIFTLFNRLHNNNEYSGNGIGLAICKKIVENHKGLITAVSIPNVGTKFKIYLPLIQ